MESNDESGRKRFPEEKVECKHFCSLCKARCTSQKQFDEHLNSDRHKAREESERIKNSVNLKKNINGDAKRNSSLTRKTATSDQIAKENKSNISKNVNCKINPLPSQFPFPNYKLVCRTCWKEKQPSRNHRCWQDMIAVPCHTEDSWMIIRKRENHTDFRGNYHTCRFNLSNVECPNGLNCSFAHNEAELQMWNLDKEGTFHIDDFIKKNQTKCESPLNTLEVVLAKFPGTFHFICRYCFSKFSRVYNQNPKNPVHCGNPHYPHNWKEFRLLVHESFNESSRTCDIVTIHQRPLHLRRKDAYYELCYQTKYCKNSKCPRAHSAIERDIWYVERDGDISHDQIMTKVSKC